MRNFLIGLVVVSLAIAFGAFAASGFIVDKMSRQAIGQMMGSAQLTNMGVASLDYGSVAPSSFSSVTWKNFSVNFYRLVKGAPDVNRSYTIWFDSLTAALDPFTKEITLKGEGIRVRPSNAATDSHTGLDGDAVSIRFFLDELDPVSAIKKIEAMIRDLVNDIWDDGLTRIEVEFSGTARFQLDGQPRQARVSLEQRGQDRLFVMDKTDLRKISATMKEELKQEEIVFTSEHPLIAPGLLRIKNKAENVSHSAWEADKSVPEDAYRHVLWSFLLAKEFGEKISEGMTNAHEVVDAKESDADRAMDLHNNKIGRAYAVNKYEESAVLGQVMTDSSVILAPEDANRMR